jgi:hypothetical protein
LKRPTRASWLSSREARAAEMVTPEERLAAAVTLDPRAVEEPVELAADEAEEGIVEGGAIDDQPEVDDRRGAEAGDVLEDRVIRPCPREHVQEGRRRDGADDLIRVELLARLEDDAGDRLIDDAEGAYGLAEVDDGASLAQVGEGLVDVEAAEGDARHAEAGGVAGAHKGAL